MLLAGCSDDVETASAEGECSAAQAVVERIAPVVGGELAAFAVAEKPRKLPELTFVDREGNQTGLGEFDGKTALINLWATWCAPCREEMPSLDQLEADLGGEDFVVAPISIDRGGSEKPLNFFSEIGIKSLPFYQDETMGVFNTLKKESLVFGLPATLLIDDEGCLLGSINGPAHWSGDDAKKLVTAAIAN